MRQTGKTIRKTSIIGRACRERFLPYRDPALRILREAGVGFSGISDLRGKYEVRRQRSPLHLVLYTLEGQGWLKTEGFEGELSPGQVWISPAGAWQMYGLADAAWRIAWFCLEDRGSWSAIRTRGTIVRSSPAGVQVANVVENLLHEHSSRGEAAEAAIDLYSRLILLLLRREVGRPSEPRESELRRRLDWLMRHVRHHLAEPWSVDRLVEAAQLDVTAGHFARLCRAQVGETPMQLVARLRLERAAESLLNTDYPLKLIARSVGYNGPFALSAAFRRHFGRSPRDYREGRGK